MQTDALVERVARAIYGTYDGLEELVPWPELCPDIQAAYIKQARAALASIPTDAAKEALGEALYGLSARLLLTKWLDDPANHAAYEKVVKAFDAPFITHPTDAGAVAYPCCEKMTGPIWLDGKYCRPVCDVHGYQTEPTADMEWRPIGSAPRDGTQILLGYFQRNLDGSIYQVGGAPVVASWNKGNWLAGRQWLRPDKPNDPFSPTHWMPLPAAPGEGV